MDAKAASFADVAKILSIEGGCKSAPVPERRVPAARRYDGRPKFSYDRSKSRPFRRALVRFTNFQNLSMLLSDKYN